VYKRDGGKRVLDGNISGARKIGGGGRRRVGNPPQVDNLPHGVRAEI
jgi:hypothetical protein